jgi:hypothetical protein
VFPKIGIAITFIYAADTRVSVVVRRNVNYFNGVWDMRQGFFTLETMRAADPCSVWNGGNVN